MNRIVVEHQSVQPIGVWFDSYFRFPFHSLLS